MPHSSAFFPDEWAIGAGGEIPLKKVLTCWSVWIAFNFTRAECYDPDRRATTLCKAHPFTNISILRKKFTKWSRANLKITIDGVAQTAKPGIVAIVPSNARHSVKALTDGRAIIVDSPARRDFV